MDLFVLVFVSTWSHFCICIWSMKKCKVCMNSEAFAIKPPIIALYFLFDIVTLLRVVFASVFVLLFSFHIILITCNVCCTYVRQPLIALIRSKSFLARQWYVHSGSSLLWTIYWNDISLLSQGTGNSQKPEAFFGTQRKYMPMKLLPWFISWNTHKPFIVLCMYCLIANSNQLSTIVSSIWEFQSVLKISNVHLHYFFQGHLLGVVRLMDGTKT